MDPIAELEAAARIAGEMGALLLDYFGSERIGTRAKGKRDVVTAADVASEQLMRQRLGEMFPEDGIVAEEGTRVLPAGERRWFVDPLDGTLNYSRGVPFWCVSLACFEGGRPVLGVVHDPIRRETFGAVRERGAWRNGQPILCSDIADLSAAVVHLTIDFSDDNVLLGLEDLQIVAPAVLRTRNMGSAALALAYVAAGRFDAMFHRFANTWDYAAGVLLVQEAGGRVSDLKDGPYTAETQAVLAAATAELHAGLVEILRAGSDRPVQ